MNIPLIQAYLQPVHPTRSFPSALFPVSVRGGGVFNYLTHALGVLLFWQLLLPAVNEAQRKYLDLPPFSRISPFPEMNREKRLVILGYRPSVLPRPPEWGSWIHVTGYWDLEPAPWQPRQELLTFLAHGPPPVYIGFGSMANRDPERLTTVAMDALHQSGQRGVLLKGWGALSQSDLPDTVLKLEEAPHAWLFPRMAALVHHGGADTTGAGLRAERPMVIIPFFGDQVFWGERVHDLGAGPPALSLKTLSAGELASAIMEAVSNVSYRDQAAALPERISVEKGVIQAVDLIQDALHKG